MLSSAKIDTSISSYDNALMMMENDTMPDSPPDLSNSSKTSKTSSLHSSYNSDDSPIFEDASHFEEIGLDDISPTDRFSDLAYGITSTLTLSPTAIGDKTYLPPSATRFPINVSNSTLQIQRKNSKTNLQSSKTRPQYVQNALRNAAPLDIHHKALGLMGPPSRKSSRNITNSSQVTLSLNYKRNTSPIPMNAPRNYPTNGNARYSAPVRSPSYLTRTSWQSNRERKTAEQLERECDEEDGDDVPEDCFLENVPISPRPPQERTPTNSRPTSRTGSAERPSKPKSKVRSMGNGTPAADVERGSLRSPPLRSPSSPHLTSLNPRMGEFPADHSAFGGKGRAMSWTAAMSELSPETRELTEALESHASELELESNPRVLSSRKSSSSLATRPPGFTPPLRVKSSMAELPPLCRTNIMIDPLPPSKEKVAVLSRTRPSWLPPKDPEEEKRHLKEYNRMIALSIEAEKKKDAEARQKEVARDDVADSLQRIWEEFVLKDWNGAMRQKRTRELWWRGISPRCRGAVWQKAIRNELELTESSYLVALRRAKDLEKKIQKGQASKDEERMGAWFQAIRKDAKKTWPELMIFQEGGPLCESLVNVLMAYSMYRSDVGYVPGTHVSFKFLFLVLLSDHYLLCHISLYKTNPKSDNNSPPPPQSPKPFVFLLPPRQPSQPFSPSRLSHP